MTPIIYNPNGAGAIEEYANLAAFPAVGKTRTLYLALDTEKLYIWTGSLYSEASSRPASSDDVPEGSLNLYWTAARFDTRFASKTTTDLTEGTNLYWTNARFDTRFDSRLATKSTSDLTEGTNLYWTDGRFDTRFDSRLATKSTSNLSEGTNLYWTDGRFDTRFAAKTTTDLTEGLNQYWTNARFDTRFDSRLATKTTTDLSEGTNLYWTNARFDTRFDTRLALKSTSDLSEGTNQYFTDSRAKTAAVVNSTAGSQTDQAPSVEAMKTYASTVGRFKSDLTFDGVEVQKDVTVTGIVDARTCQIQLLDASSNYERIFCKITATSTSNVRINTTPALPAGTYRLVVVE